MFTLLELIQTGKIRVREMITHRLGLAETGHYCLSLRGAAGDAAISLALNSDYCLLTTDYWLLTTSFLNVIIEPQR